MNLEIVDEPEDSSLSDHIECPVCGVSEKQNSSDGFDFDHAFEHFFWLAGFESVLPIKERLPEIVVVCRGCGNIFFHSLFGPNADLVKLQKGNLWDSGN